MGEMALCAWVRCGGSNEGELSLIRELVLRGGLKVAQCSGETSLSWPGNLSITGSWGPLELDRESVRGMTRTEDWGKKAE